MTEYDAFLPAPMCALGAVFDGEALVRLDFLPGRVDVTAPSDSRAVRLAHDLDAYWADPAHAWKTPITPAGTPFQRRVWHALTEIPVGEATTYGALAKTLGTAPRAVGQACGSNPLPILIPCHRVVAAHGLGGFMHASGGAPLDVKSWLLRHEAAGTTRPAHRSH